MVDGPDGVPILPAMHRLIDESGRRHALVDSFGRVVRNLRVSLTDRCTLRCRYCMPAEGLAWTPAEDLLTDDEVVRLVGLAVQRLGVRHVRFTGGEPLLRPGLESIIAQVAATRGPDRTAPTTSLTTNGVGLARRAEGLVAAGLDRVNVSLDTLDPNRFAAITRRDRLSDVLAGLAAAHRAGLAPIKVNSVLVRGVNDDEACHLLRWALDEGYQLRFIEQMPLGPADAWDPARFVAAQEILDALGAQFRLTPVADRDRGAAPARTWRVDGTDAVVGVIASVSWPFCETCDRVRLTADGQVRNCLFATQETDVRTMLRAGADDDALVEAWVRSVAPKAEQHGIFRQDFVPPARTMSAIGG